ncbi:anti-sigma factor RsbA family regulatory protein [Plantactinospora siamensis]|uniref:Anti-sigma factor RsbA family regulatory protein n=1 Tax=Plantactinospora siamensis TaxID=555372 RepID=A0ABV6P728_9ACTN
MRTGAAAGHRGHYHAALCYDSDPDLLAVVLPFLLDGMAAGEPVVVALRDRTAALVRAALPADGPVSYLDPYSRPTAVIRSYREMLAGHVAAGAAQVRVVGEMPASAFGATWDWWARYEAATNHAYDEFPLWSLCAFDTRVTPAAVLDDVARTHPWTALPGGRHTPNGTYTEPAAFLAEDRPMLLDPAQRTGPAVELADPTPAQARAALRRVDPGLPADDVDDLIVAVSEVVTNALRHGRPPVLSRVWTTPDRIVVTVSDGGTGPRDLFVGLLPTRGPGAGGLGLWITHQSCSHVTQQRGPDDYTLRLTAGNPQFPIG